MDQGSYFVINSPICFRILFDVSSSDSPEKNIQHSTKILYKINIQMVIGQTKCVEKHENNGEKYYTESNKKKVYEKCDKKISI